MQQKLQKLKTNFLFFLELQLLISIVILPILIPWGLPISIMAIAGNLIFAQFLTAFIFVATALFCCDLVGISNYWPIQALQLITDAWHYLLSFGSAHWLVGFSSWLFPISLIFAIIACGLYYEKKQSQNFRIIFLLILFCAIPCIHSLFTSKLSHTVVMQGNQKMHLIKVQGKVYAFDCGALGARPCSQSWIEYTLAPTMVKTMGTMSLQALILCNCNSRTDQAAKNLVEHIPTEQIIIAQKSDVINSCNNFIDKNMQSLDFIV